MCDGSFGVGLSCSLCGCPRRKYSSILQAHSGDLTLNKQIKIFSKLSQRQSQTWLTRQSRELPPPREQPCLPVGSPTSAELTGNLQG